MMFITLRVFLSTERKKLVVAPDLIAKEGQKFLTMVLDRGYVGVSIKGRSSSSLGYEAEDVKNVGKQTNKTRSLST
jgi:hypothetical protein